MADLRFKQTLLWENKTKLCSLKKTKNGNYLGTFSHNFRLTIEKQKMFNSEEYEFVAYLVPVKHEKID